MLVSGLQWGKGGGQGQHVVAPSCHSLLLALVFHRSFLLACFFCFTLSVAHGVSMLQYGSSTGHSPFLGMALTRAGSFLGFSPWRGTFSLLYGTSPSKGASPALASTMSPLHRPSPVSSHVPPVPAAMVLFIWFFGDVGAPKTGCKKK